MSRFLKNFLRNFLFQVDSEQVFQEFAAQGQSYFNASGDNDAYSGTIDAPADDPYITIVGGTSLATSYPLTLAAAWLCLVVIGLVAQAAMAQRRSEFEQTFNGAEDPGA